MYASVVVKEIWHFKIDIVWFKGLKFSSTQGATKSPLESLRDSVPTSIKMKSKVPDLYSKKKIDDGLKSSVPSALSPDEPQRVHETGNRKTILLNGVQRCSKWKPYLTSICFLNKLCIF